MDINKKNNNEKTALYWALGKEHKDVALWLMKKGEMIHNAAAAGFLKNVKFFKEYGVEIDAKDTFLQTPLHFASFFGKFEVVKYLVENGADINSQHNDGNTPLHEAALGNHINVVKYLVDCGAKIVKNNEEKFPKDLAKDEDIKKIFEEKEDIKSAAVSDSLSTALALLKAKLLQLASSLQNK